ncbi:hypothetical protein BDD12DRAFT_811271 [Trichophaea hybrida]|nr:hypothetical protein BDD12DRAFT_811271 [Trichophaea hybrida]
MDKQELIARVIQRHFPFQSHEVEPALLALDNATLNTLSSLSATETMPPHNNARLVLLTQLAERFQREVIDRVAGELGAVDNSVVTFAINYLDGPLRERIQFLVHDENALRNELKNLADTLRQANYEWSGRKPRASAPRTPVPAYTNSPRNDAYANDVRARDNWTCCVSHTKHPVPTEVSHAVSQGCQNRHGHFWKSLEMFFGESKTDQLYMLCGGPLVHHPRNNLLLQPTIHKMWDKGLLRLEVPHELQARFWHSLEWDGKPFDIIVRVSGLEEGSLVMHDPKGGFKPIQNGTRIKIGSESSDFDNIHPILLLIHDWYARIALLFRAEGETSYENGSNSPATPEASELDLSKVDYKLEVLGQVRVVGLDVSDNVSTFGY